MNRFLLSFCLLLMTVSSAFVIAKTTSQGYQKPPKEILDLVDVKLAPRVILDDSKSTMVFLYRDSFKTIEELSQQEMRLAGLRIDPKTNIGSRINYYKNIMVKSLAGNGELTQVSGLPENPRLTNLTWSPNQQYMAMTHTSEKGVELWLLNVKDAKAKQLTEAMLNANLRDVINWFADSESMLIKTLASNRKPLIDTAQAIPKGPTISVSKGEKAQNRTYQDLLKNKDDEFNFEQLALSELHKVSIDGDSEKWLPAAMYTSVSLSPNGDYVLVYTIEKPFSYLVTYSRFPSVTQVYSKSGKPVRVIEQAPLAEVLPKGFMSTVTHKRNIQWRNDKPATLVYVKALDKGDPKVDVEFRDEVFSLAAPFDGEPETLLKTNNRFYTIMWGNDAKAIAMDYWWNTRNLKTYLFNPSDNSQTPKVINDRNYQDRYSDPGNFVMTRNALGRSVLDMREGSVYLLGDGFTKSGQFPFLDKLNLETQDKTRLYQSTYDKKLEDLIDFDVENDRLVTRIESKSEYPNYYFRKLNRTNKADEQLTQVTHFENPFKSLQNVEKRVLEYKRDDGLSLSGTLFLPTDYQKGKRYPMILWAYPREYKDKSTAGQNTQNPNEFTYPYWGSPIYWVSKGYVVLDDAAFPIVGEGEEEPNDSFRSQLVANAKAAIDAVDNLGLIDRERVAVGGHSYGAFMVANLLSHSDLFAAGIARSGAYNRTLTPFGFQSEERSYWDAPEVYYTMSPFMHADKMKTPMLLIHGKADNNSGTYPLQSERYFNALKGLGAPVRLVMLPKESHGYRAKESILHLLWEQDRWLDMHVKNKSDSSASQTGK
jgi:dipeptidyl aminopeptidase/acylaminoacyl peptidase